MHYIDMKNGKLMTTIDVCKYMGDNENGSREAFVVHDNNGLLHFLEFKGLQDREKLERPVDTRQSELRTSIDNKSGFAGYNNSQVPEFIDLGPIYPKYSKEPDRNGERVME